MATVKELVLHYIRRDKVKLWIPPYRNLPTQGGDANNDALIILAKSLINKISSSENNISPTPTQDEVYNVLIELQSHAVQKLKEKNSINIKILGSSIHFGNLPKTEEDYNNLFCSWGDEVCRATTQVSGSNNSLLLRVTNLSSKLTIGTFSSDICCALDAKTVRLIYKGQNLSGKSSEDTLKKIMEDNTNSAGNNENQQKKKKKNELLCLVSGFGYVPPSAASTTSITSPPSDTERSDSDIIVSIRQAASTVQNSCSQRFEITDQSGNLVTMHHRDMVAFLTALGLHRIGRSKMEKRQQTNVISDEDGYCGRDEIASALVFLLEADAEWNNSAALNGWKSKVDNYGLLQLDIAWCYLLLESLDDLTDAVTRLDIAEQVLRKQTHTNFVTLALTQAEMDNPIPPLCAIFVRLFLLQGVAKTIQNCSVSATERLGWARLLCNRLRSTCPEDVVSTLCNAYFVDPCTARYALRRSNGDPDAAGNFITTDRDEERQAAKKRRRQHKFGKCANGADYVNVDLVPTLSSLLNFDNGDSIISIQPAELPTSALIVIGLLRLSNNVLDQALELYNSIGADQVLERIASLDEASSGSRKRQSKSTKQTTGHEVRDVDLTVLISMGVNAEKGREALAATGNVESALLWLSRDDTAASDINDGKIGENEIVSNNSESDNSMDSTSGQAGSQHNEIDDAYELLERELGNALSTDSKQLLEKEWLGVDMNEEWRLLQKYLD